MTDQPEYKTCQTCNVVFYRRQSSSEQTQQWLRRKYCSTTCARAKYGHQLGKLTKPARPAAARP